MDSAFATRPYPALSLTDLRGMRATGTINAPQLTELARREAVEGGDYAQATPTERLRAIREGKL